MLVGVVACGAMGSSSRVHGIKCQEEQGQSAALPTLSPGSSVASHCKMCQRVSHTCKAVEDSRGAWACHRKQKLAGKCSHPSMKWADSAAGWGWGRGSTLHPLLHQDGDSRDKNTFSLTKVKGLLRSLGCHQVRSSVLLSVGSCACAGHGAPSRDSRVAQAWTKNESPNWKVHPRHSPDCCFVPPQAGAEQNTQIASLEQERDRLSRAAEQHRDEMAALRAELQQLQDTLSRERESSRTELEMLQTQLRDKVP